MLPKEFPYWLRGRGLDHAVVLAEGFVFLSRSLTACGLTIKNHWPRKVRPCRVCRRCREALKGCVLSEEGEKAMEEIRAMG